MLAALYPVTHWAFGDTTFMMGTIEVTGMRVFIALASGLIAGLLIGTVLLVGALTFVPALVLGPVVEHFLMHAGNLY